MKILILYDARFCYLIQTWPAGSRDLLDLYHYCDKKMHRIEPMTYFLQRLLVERFVLTY